MAHKKAKDRDYLFLSSYIHARETHLLSAEDLERMVSAPSKIEVGRVLEEAGYEGIVGASIPALERKLTEKRLEFYRELDSMAPDPAVLDIFRAKYDYHNAKAVIKGLAQNRTGTRSLSDLGRIPAREMMEAIVRDDTDALPEILAGSVAQAREKLAKTGNAQAADQVMDNGYFREITALAASTGSKGAAGYVRLLADVTNLRTLVRIQRQKQPEHALRLSLVEGGSVSPEEVLAAAEAGRKPDEIFAGPELKQAAMAGTEAVSGGTLTEFERLCDSAMNAYCAEIRRESFGPATLIAYLHLLENEDQAVRIIVTSRAAGLRGDSVRERLRDV
ncbi:MAG: V-type ATPase subunit [Oscillospiraceae bacterium]|nr:V-type ATPase subunit [Oscillospiraceae bacterium]